MERAGILYVWEREDGSLRVASRLPRGMNRSHPAVLARFASPAAARRCRPDMETLRIRDDSVLAPLMEYALSDLRAGALRRGLLVETEDFEPPEARFLISAKVRDPKGALLFRTFGRVEAQAAWTGGPEGSFGRVRLSEENDPADAAAVEELLRRIPTSSVEELLLASLGIRLGLLPAGGKRDGVGAAPTPDEYDRVRRAIAGTCPRPPSPLRLRETPKKFGDVPLPRKGAPLPRAGSEGKSSRGFPRSARGASPGPGIP